MVHTRNAVKNMTRQITTFVLIFKIDATLQYIYDMSTIIQTKLSIFNLPLNLLIAVKNSIDGQKTFGEFSGGNVVTGQLVASAFKMHNK